MDINNDYVQRFIIEPGLVGFVSLMENLRVLVDWIYAQGKECWNILEEEYNTCTEIFRLIGNGDLYLHCDKIFQNHCPEINRYAREELVLNHARCREYYY